MKKNNVLSRAVGTGKSAGENLGAYKNEKGQTTTYRPEFAGQTVQLGNQYVTYNESGSPTKAVSVKHAQSLGNDYTKQYMGLDQTKVSNAGDIYRGIYNATMENPAVAQGALTNAYGKRNIQYDNGLGVQDYDKLIRDAAAQGSNVLAGYYEDSRNALLHTLGGDKVQSSTYNGGWNWVDNGGGVGNIYAGALRDGVQTDQAFGGGWYAGQGKGNAAEEYFHLNTDAPSMQETLGYAAYLGYDVNDETQRVPIGALSRELMAKGYVSPATLQKAQTLKTTVPAALRNLGMESDRSGTEALDMAIQNMQSAGGYGGDTYGGYGNHDGGYNNGYGGSFGGYGGQYGGYGNGYGSIENQLLNLYGNGGGYTAAQRQLRDLTDAKTQLATLGYEAQKGAVNHSYADMFRQLYIDRENSKKNLAQQLSAQGLTGGASESALLGIDTGYAEALRQGEQARIGALSELEQAILQAQLTGDLSYAQQALQLEQDRLDGYAGVLQMLLERQEDAAAEAYDREMDKAALLASMGDFSGYKALGLTDEQIAALGNAYWAKQA